MSLLRDIVFMVGAVILAITTLIGLAGIVFDTEEVLERGTIYGLTWFEIIFILLVISFWMVIIRLILRIRTFEKSRPSISVIPPYSTTKEAVIQVSNRGGNALFSANARLVGVTKPPNHEDSYPETYPFTMVWEETSADTIEIVKGSQRRIRLVSYMVDKNGQGKETHWLRFWKYTAQGAVPIDVGHWQPEKESPDEVGIMVRIDTNLPVDKQRMYIFNILPLLNLGVNVKLATSW
jgi:hypothetical protein